MAFSSRAALVLALTLWCGACGEEEPPVDRLGVNIVDKALFEGSWYMSRTVIDVDYEAAGLGTFPGDVASDQAQTFTAMPRIRWVIDEDFLFAYRDYELTPGADGDDKSGRPVDEEGEDIFGQPVAAFAIETHLDIRRSYNSSTGEDLNVVVENTTDRRWFERDFMRVDWSKNLLPGYFGQTLDLNALLGVFTREPADLYVQDASQFPDSWQPRFDRMGCDGSDDDSDKCSQAERDFADDYDKGQLYHMSFVTQELLSPDAIYCGGSLSCSAINTHVRTSFLRVSDRRQYNPVNWNDSRFDRFGLFRLSQSTYDRSTGEPDDPAFFYTDFLNYNANRHNIWKNWNDSDGQPLAYDERDVRPIVWYSTPELPAHLVEPSFDVVGEWNETFMATVRQLRGEALPSYPSVDCQDDDPDGYCFCQPDPESGEIMTPVCPGAYDPFKAPDEYGPGTERPYDCWVDVPEGARPNLDDPALSDTDFYGWYGARMVGDECVNQLRINTCNRASIADNDGTVEGMECEERGDLRFKFLSYIDQPGTGFLGIATLRGDPETGEIITGDANIGGPALDSFRTSALQTYDLINGTLDERDIITGENTREYFENLGYVDLPAKPRTDFSVASRSGPTPLGASTKAEIDGRMESAMHRISRLQGPDGQANTFSDRKLDLIGTDLERRLTAGIEGLVAAGVDTLDEDGAVGDLTDEQLDRMSPFRRDVNERLADIAADEDKLSRANVMMPNEYVDDSVQWFVSKHADWPRARLEFAVNRLLYRQTQLHEMGHCLGLRHNFGSSADSEHYHPDYYEITERFPLPDPQQYDLDGSPGLNTSESAEFEKDYGQIREYRELSGIDGAMNSSVMEYSANWYQRLQPLGRYDKASVAYTYGDLVEAYDGPAAPDSPREMFRNYMGGESCEVDADCPYAPSGKLGGLLLDSNRDAGLSQRCVKNPKTPSANLCSSLDDDLAQMAADGGDYRPAIYRFCSDSRADTTLAWCNRFDEGDSYREIVRNVAEDYERMYPFSAFRRYRSGFSAGGYQSALLGRRLGVLQNIYQNLIFQYTSVPEFRDTQGPFGFYDQFLATTDVLNFYAKIMTQPRIGGYNYNSRTGTYQRTFLDPEAPDADIAVPLGLGRYLYSDYQGGLTGIQRLERIGSFQDKVLAIQLLTIRGWSTSYTRDVAFDTNFYDLFPNEMQQIFNGMIRGFPAAYMPRVVCDSGEADSACSRPRLVYMDFYRGDCSTEESCRPNPAEVTYGNMPVLDGGASLSLQIYAVLFGLIEFPVYFDSTFQNQLFICVKGQGDCHEPGSTAVDGTDFVRHTSERYRKTFLAWQVEPSVGVGEQTSIGFAMVKEASDLALTLRLLEKLRDGAPAYSLDNLTMQEKQSLADINYVPPTSPPVVLDEISRIDVRIQNLESFFNQIIELERRYGIQGYRYYP